MKNFLLILILFPALLLAQTKRPITVEDLWAMKRIDQLVLSPDGTTIAFSVNTYNLDANKGKSEIYLINAGGSNLHQLNNSDKSESDPRFSPDGKKIAYLENDQVRVCNLDGSDNQQLTDLYTGVTDFKWSNDGSKILLTSNVYADCPNQDCNKKKDEEKKAEKYDARIITHLMFRHWNEWLNGKRSHLFLFDVASKKYFDLNYLMHNDVPPLDLGSANDFNFSPGGKEIAYTMNPNPVVANSTNNDVFTVNMNDVKADSKIPAKKISVSLGNDNEPVYSPDGKFIAFASMLVPGHESDKQCLVLYDRATGKLKNLTEKFDRSVAEIVWSPDSKEIYFTANNEIYNSIYKIDIQSEKVSLLLKEHSNADIAVSPDGKTIYFKQQRAELPYEIFAMNNDGSNIHQITFLNKELLSKLELNPVETFWSKGAGGRKIESILMKPPFFNPSKKYPMILLIHGGPQDNWQDEFHYRWNLELFASKGYVVVAPNPTGSTGYGQKFTNDISRDWGGKAYTDLMDACDYAIKTYKFIDPKNTFAAGASYGGYMIDWLEGHTSRFNALVSHDGVFNTVSMWGTTEELWFPNWEFKGTPFTNRALYEKWNPERFIQNAKTPMLIVEGAHDYRVPEEQAFQLFTSLQSLGVESKLLYFNNEFHFVVKPQDSKLWWNTVFDWFQKHKK
ncbi:MAG: dipeptidyl-peptidase 5 [Ignavibacteriaceae bacterium]